MLLGLYRVVQLQFEFESKTKGDTVVKNYFSSYCKVYYGEVLNGNSNISVVKNSVMGLLGLNALCRLYIIRIRKGAQFFLEVPIANQSLCSHEVY